MRKTAKPKTTKKSKLYKLYEKKLLDFKILIEYNCEII
jgi:hypothetical protein